MTGLNIICICDTNHRLQLTEGATYRAMNVSESYHPYNEAIAPMNKDASGLYLYLNDDLGQDAYYPYEIFLPVNILRDKKLNQLDI